MTKFCDNFSVGVIIEHGDKIVLLKRAVFPVGIAPPAGHIDDHGSPEQTAVDEVYEELGLTIRAADLIKTPIANRRVKFACHRIGGDYHDWWVFRTTHFTGTLRPDPAETQGADWYGRDQLQALADRTQQMHSGALQPDEWQHDPGLEEVWLGFMSELGYIDAD